MPTPSLCTERGQHRARRQRRGVSGSTGVRERLHSHGMARQGTWEAPYGPRKKAGRRTPGGNKRSGPAPACGGSGAKQQASVVLAGESISRRDAVRGVVAPS